MSDMDTGLSHYVAKPIVKGEAPEPGKGYTYKELIFYPDPDADGIWLACKSSTLEIVDLIVVDAWGSARNLARHIRGLAGKDPLGTLATLPLDDEPEQPEQEDIRGIQ